MDEQINGAEVYDPRTETERRQASERRHHENLAAIAAKTAQEQQRAGANSDAPLPPPLSPFAHAVVDEITAIGNMLIGKNAAYGNSALDPLRCFSRADPVEQIKVRIDDKISRLKRGSAAGDDVVLDLIGYLILLRIAQRGFSEQQ